MRNANIKDCGQTNREKVCHRLRPNQAVDAHHGLQDKQCRDENDSLTAQIDDKCRGCRSHCLQRIDKNIEHTEQEARCQQDPGELNCIRISCRVREEGTDDLVGKQIADHRQHCTQRQCKQHRKTERLFKSLPQFCTNTVAQKRLYTLSQSHADHAGNGNDLHCHTHAGHSHVPVFCKLTVDDDLSNTH